MNIQNFYDLLAINNSKITLAISVVPVFKVTPPIISICVDKNQLYDGELTDGVTLSSSIDIASPFMVEITLKDKNYTVDSESAIIIKSLNIDGFEIVPSWTNKATYINDHQFTQPTNYLGFNGIWKLEIDRPFYHWRHEITGQGWLLEPI